MNKSTHLEGLNCPCSLTLAACLALTLLPAAAQGPAWSVADRGAFYSVWQTTVSSTDGLTGQVSQQVASYTELGDGLNYWNDGQWIDSQDLIEIAPAGAAAVHGQMTASFSGDITAAGAITLTTPSGLVFQSHPIGLYYADPVSGKVAQIGSAQTTEGVLYPPNVIVFTNVLSGLSADLMLVWTKGGFEQNLVIKEAPPAPEAFGLSSAACRLQFWTAMDCPAPQEQRPVLLGSGLVDHILMYPDCWFPVGCAFAFGSAPLPAPGEAAAIRLYSPSRTNAIPTAKSLVTIAGQQVLIEEVNYADLLPAFSGLSQASLAPGNRRAVELAARRQLLPAPASRKPHDHPIQVASAPYGARGVVLDYVQLSGSTNSYTFTSGTTYCISNSFYIGSGTAVFQAGACVKSALNAWLIAYGSVSFPAGGSNVVFTSVNDNSYGTVISNSTGMPNFAAGEALWMYYQTNTSTVQNSLFRWAQTGIEYNENGGVVNSPTNSSSVFQNCNIGVYVNIPSDTLHLSGVSECNVLTPISDCMYCGSVSGSMTVNCGVVNVSNADVSHGEPAIAVNPTDPQNVVLAANNTCYFTNLLIAVSKDGGTTWTNWPAPGMGCDPTVAFDDFGNLFIASIANSNLGYLVVLLSTNKGSTFTDITPPGLANVFIDQPTLATGPGGTIARGSVWITGNYGYPYGYPSPTNHVIVCGAPVTGLGQITSSTWSNVVHIANSTWGDYGDIAIGPTGQVAVTFQYIGVPERPTPVYFSLNPSGLAHPTNFPNPSLVLTSVVCVSDYIPPIKSRGCDVEPGLAWDRCTSSPYYGRLYLAYTDADPSATNNTDIWVISSDNGGATWSSPAKKVNDDSTTTSQFDPRMAVDQTTGNIAVSWYDCRADPSADQKTRFYAAVSRDGGATFSANIRLESGQSNATLCPCENQYFDFTGLAYYGGVFYPAWADNSSSSDGHMDIYVAKVPY